MRNNESSQSLFAGAVRCCRGACARVHKPKTTCVALMATLSDHGAIARQQHQRTKLESTVCPVKLVKAKGKAGRLSTYCSRGSPCRCSTLASTSQLLQICTVRLGRPVAAERCCS